MAHSDDIIEALDPHEVEAKLTMIPEWDADMDVSTLSRVFAFPDFKKSMAFTNAVAEIAEELNHHPDMLVTYDSVTIVLTTHSAGGITEKDFMLASKIDKLPQVNA